MKRKHLSLISLLLALCLLLSSCGAAGALQPPFLKLLGNAASGFFTNAKNLLQGNAPLILEGRVNYRTETDSSCPDAVAALSAAIKERTGHDLSENTDETAPRLRIGQYLEEKKTTAATFFVGFSEEGDLLITAKSDVMLREAIRYFETTFVTGDKANCGAGYLYVPGDLAYVSESLQLIGDDNKPLYSVAYAKDANKNTFAAVTELINVVRSATGVSLSMQDKYFETSGEADAREILIGLTTREESIEATNALDDYSYYIGIKGNKIIITAKNSYLLARAVERFIQCFISHLNSDSSAEEHRLALPASLSFTETEGVLLLSRDSTTDYALIYPAGADERLIETVQLFCRRFRAMTGATLTAYSDAERPESAENETEILVGDTNRHASVLAGADLKDGQWTVSLAGKRLVVSGDGVEPLETALNRLFANLLSLAEWQNDTRDEEHPRAKLPNLCLPADFALPED